MGRDEGVALLGRVERVRRRIEEWRSSRGSGSPMGEDLWEAAVVLAQEYGVYAIARSLRVDYGALKRRVDRLGTAGAAGWSSEASPFVEVRGEELLAAEAPASTEPASTEPAKPIEVEVLRADGARLVMRVGGRECLDLLALARAFWAGAAS